jgi:hypothetical protein
VTGLSFDRCDCTGKPIATGILFVGVFWEEGLVSKYNAERCAGISHAGTMDEPIKVVFSIRKLEIGYGENDCFFR